MTADGEPPVNEPTIAGDVAAFAARAARLDPGSLVLVRGGRIWAALPIGVLAVRDAGPEAPADGVYRAGGLAAGTSTAQPAAAWRGRLPQQPWATVETVPAADIADIDRKAAEALRERRGQGVGERRLRDAMLDHVALRVEHDGGTAAVEVRLVAALCRMGFLAEDPVRVLQAGRRTGLAATYGAVWERDRGLPLL
ncbi:hypothetical protein K3N28_03630 [Glycomyces sp. TRM65418]|uniref:hypothetical protein n=1 Tax=Glycomyces sp. TRM65418 TaxID=2867006 RepID=UPI001CE6D33D|nr:hypothetical protein [Glycomyces sp. TRM65418]MCC3762163.1 hypothetical protein [Glycomyces sp. TRM65418]QZD56227.1 hypothetical protein K3N28_03610 [Glycomyces sp. TRM65418]